MEQKVPFVTQGGPLLGPDERQAIVAWRGPVGESPAARGEDDTGLAGPHE